MDAYIQWVWSDNTTLYLLATAEGSLDVADFSEMMRRVGEAFVALDGAAVFDLRKARWDLDKSDINAIAAGFVQAGLRMDNKIALVCGRDLDQYGQLLIVASGASNRGFKARAFYDFDGALKWLAEKWNNY
jgi:hypothetical protein